MFTINFDNVWNETGYATKYKTKKILINNFKNNIDFINIKGKFNKDIILLTNDCYIGLINKYKNQISKSPISENINEKWCITCKQFIDISNFSKDKQKKDGLDSRCKNCKIIKTKTEKENYKNINEEKKTKNYPAKKCSDCKQIFSREKFYKDKSSASGLYDKCIECHKIHSKEIDDKIYEHKKNKKLNKKCELCGMDDIRLLQNDHVDPKSKNFTIASQRNLKKVDEEWEKTQLLCNNCHRLKSKSDYNYKNGELSQNYYSIQKRKKQQRNKNYVNSVKLMYGKCLNCDFEVNENNFRVFDFHHLNPENKIMQISKMINRGTAIKTIYNEILKCAMLCANCHYIITGKTQKYRAFKN